MSNSPPAENVAQQRARRWRALPYRWALRSAPVITSAERLVLSAYADHADPDGTGAYPGPTTLVEITLLDESTIKRSRRALVARGLMAEGDQSRARRLPSGQRPKVMDVLVPYAWYRDQRGGEEVLRDINASRTARGLTPLTPEARPTHGPPPARKVRADKGKPKTKIGESDATSTGQEGAHSPPLATEENSEEGLEAPPREGSKPVQEGAHSTPTAPVHLAVDRNIPGDGRRPSTGSDGLSLGGEAASSKSASRATVSVADLRAVVERIPSVLAGQLQDDFPRGLPGAVNEAIACAIADEQRTVDQVVARVERRWIQWSYEDDAIAESGQGLARPLGVLLALLGPAACWGNNARCEDGIDTDTGEPCPRCVEAREDKAGPGRSVESPVSGYSVPFQSPSFAPPSRYVHCQGARCGVKMLPTSDGLCRECRAELANVRVQ